MDILAGLNQRQREAVERTEGPLLVLAGAGSGKTRLIVHRIAYLIARGVSPKNILAVTFTNKAADEMRTRTIDLVGAPAESVLICTFHSLCARILRQNINKLPRSAELPAYKPGFTIYDADDRKRLIAACLKELGLPHNADSVKKAGRLISLAKLHARPDAPLPERFPQSAPDWAGNLYTLYLKHTCASNALDFDDLLWLTLILLQSNEEVLSALQRRFKYCMVDEFQDTNRAQYLIIKKISDSHRNLLVVGDDDQSIYGFRGADLRNIMKFEADFPDAKVIALDQNYRSSKKILETATSLISKNQGRRPKSLWTANPPGEPVVFCTCSTQQAEAEFVIGQILKIRRMANPNLERIGVFYRTNAQSRALEDALIRHQIPYTVVKGLRFYERKEVKDALAYLRAAVNPDDDLALLRIINTPTRGIGKATVKLILDQARLDLSSAFAALQKAKDSKRTRPSVRARLNDFCSLIGRLHFKSSTDRPAEFVKYLLDETGLLDFLADQHDDASKARVDNVNELITAAKAFEDSRPDATVSDFVHHISLLTEIDQFEERNGSVSLLTLHSAKGLEFDVVFVVGVEDGLLPHHTVRTREQLEEERRLMYVGMTRAKRQLILTRAWYRPIFGRTTINRASPFIDEIPSALLARKVYYGDEGLDWPSGPTEGGRY